MYKNIKDDLINLFASKDQNRTKFTQANDWTDEDTGISYWCVTDALIAILIPHDLLEEAGQADLNLTPVFKGFVRLNTPIVITLNQIKHSLKICDNQPDHDEVYKECPVCDGDGVCTCSCCNDSHSCNRCNGDGEILISKTPNGKLKYGNADVLGDTQVIRIGAGLFDPNFISKIGNAIKLLGLDDKMIEVTHNSVDRGSVLNIGTVKMIMMPMNPTGKYEVKADLK